MQIAVVVLATMMATACGSSKKIGVDTTIEKKKSIEGEKIMVENGERQGIAMYDALSEDGTKIVKVAYKWFSGIGKSKDKQTAIEMSEREARATISRVIETAVRDEAERSTVGVNVDVQKAIKSHWEQMSVSIQNACEPIGNTKVEYSPTTQVYTVTSQVGMRGDRYQQMLNSAANYKPKNLTGAELDEFIKTNQAIINAAKK